MTSSFSAASLITLICVLQITFFAILVSIARVKLQVPAPQMSGPPAFDRICRIHMNSVEQVVVFLPVLWIASFTASPIWINGCGALYLLGRFMYWRSYLNDPEKRHISGALGKLALLPLLYFSVWAIAKHSII